MKIIKVVSCNCSRAQKNRIGRQGMGPTGVSRISFFAFPLFRA
jgi:hypothetical protein